MSRTVTAAAQAAMSAQQVSPVAFLKFTLASGDVCLCSADRNITWDGSVYTGAGDLGSISDVSASDTLQAAQVRFSLSGIAANLLSAARSEQYQGRRISLWIGFLDVDTWALIADPVLIWKGIIDQMQITFGETATITLIADNLIALWERPRIRRYSNADQQAAYPGDLGFEFIEQAAEKEIVWGVG